MKRGLVSINIYFKTLDEGKRTCSTNRLLLGNWTFLVGYWIFNPFRSAFPLGKTVLKMRNGEISNIQQGMSKDEGKRTCSTNRLLLGNWTFLVGYWIFSPFRSAFPLGKTVLKMRNGKISNIQQGMSKDEGKKTCSAKRLLLGNWTFLVGHWIFNPFRSDLPPWKDSAENEKWGNIQYPTRNIQQGMSKDEGKTAYTVHRSFSSASLSAVN
jgi:uncharacterized membrane protein YiaA